MLADRTEAIQSGRPVDRESRGREVARLVLDGAAGPDRRLDERLGRRIAALAAMAAAMHVGEATARRRSAVGDGEGSAA